MAPARGQGGSGSAPRGGKSSAPGGIQREPTDAHLGLVWQLANPEASIAQGPQTRILDAHEQRLSVVSERFPA
ncbi:MAG: hypothetical protein WAK57_14885, partial [Desulfobacterales bacterium]